jgi:hypothetical protein
MLGCQKLQEGEKVGERVREKEGGGKERGRKCGRESEREGGRRKGEREESAGFGGWQFPFSGKLPLRQQTPDHRNSWFLYD